MRRQFFVELNELMEENENVVALTGDLGFGGFDIIREKWEGTRFWNVGAAEQTMLDVAVGLALKGKIPFVYTITPFYLRGFETIRTYVNHEKLPVIMIGSGRDKDYAHDGFSHDASDISKFLEPLKNIKTYYPNDKSQIRGLLETLIKDPIPAFISLKR